jgi:hypothetical protein
MGPRTLAETRPLAKKTVPEMTSKGRALNKTHHHHHHHSLTDALRKKKKRNAKK